MPIEKKPKVQAVTFKIPMELADRMEALAKQCKALGFTYDSTEAVIKALRKDIEASEEELKLAKAADDARPTDRIKSE